MKKSKLKTYLALEAIASFIGIMLLLIDDFAGFYHYDYYNKIRIWGFVGLGNGVLGSVLILIGALALLFSLYTSIRYLRMKKISVQSLKKDMKRVMISGIFVSALAGIGALVFIITNVIDETQEWWLDSGFYGAFIGGILIIILAKIILNKLKTKK
ncbi:hypothetical protein GOV14_01440 [Candidatus Pacearchaeota archaeon]|nr:hypothetical protein [Candidatus Pacearchaeota archaeon]